MPEFHRLTINDETQIRGAARLMWAGTTISVPTTISDMINLSTYDATANWNDLGATKTGVQVIRNNTEETIDVDQVITDIDSFPSGWTMAVQTNLAEMNLEKLQVAWQAGAVTTQAAPGSPTGTEKVLQVGAPLYYIRRRLAVLYQRPSGKIRAHVFRLVNRSPQESSLMFNKTGEQQSVPVRFEAFPDLSINVPENRFGIIIDQQ